MKKIKIAIAGVGNCASSLLQGIEYYRDRTTEQVVGLMTPEIGGYRPSDDGQKGIGRSQASSRVRRGRTSSGPRRQ